VSPIFSLFEGMLFNRIATFVTLDWPFTKMGFLSFENKLLAAELAEFNLPPAAIAGRGFGGTTGAPVKLPLDLEPAFRLFFLKLPAALPAALPFAYL